ncbi:MAG: S41 family peptidase [Ignavibacteriaceae bacterium]|jgi:carboxyl-terminal processing protease|nr:S41 family peptidase [Ignavibacteriaceae bacterium]MCU0406084.1 S41 family peptidase [Ignavibacteriaceae bacterium]
MNKIFKVPVLIIILTIGIVLGIQIEKIFSDDSLRDGVRKLNDVLSYTQRYYIEEVDTPKLVEAAIKGITDELDPHSFYISAKDFTAVEESFRGDFEGIGIEFQIVDDTLTVVSPITGGPSEALGILPGDRIVKIDGEDCIGINNDQVREKLRGEAGSKVKVSISRTGVNDLIEYEITRDKIPLYSVDVSLMLKDKTGYVSVSRFSETTLNELNEALTGLKQQGMTKLILDLRGNPGGYLSQAVEMADMFIDGKKKIVYTEGRRKDANEEYFASKTTPFEQVPLIVLINHGSASASEIVSGAIQDWDRGLIIGETSFGKGLVQRQFTLSDNSAIRLTISKYFTPSGRSIQRDYKDKKKYEEYYANMEDTSLSEGNNIEHIAEQDTSKPIFKTKKGRTVYGGGGITPDYILKNERITAYTSNLLRKNVFYQHILNYVEKNGKIIISTYGTDLSKFINEFEFSESEMQIFISFAGVKEVEFNATDYKMDKDYIATRLKAQLARNYWKNEGWYSVMLTTDSQIEKAMSLFDEAKQIADLK